MSARTPIEQFLETLAVTMGKILSEKPPGAWTVKVDGPQNTPSSGTQVMTLLLLAEPSKAEAAILISLESALVLAGAVARVNPPPTQLSPEHAQAVRALFAKACETAAQVLQLQVQVQPSKGLSWTPTKQFLMSASDGGAGKFQFHVFFASDWSKGPSQTATSATPGARSTPSKGGNISLLEGIELAVTLRFGQCQLSLREIGQLRSGSLVELDKCVQDPAELLVGDRVVARGEVVVVDGNYGLRVTEVV